MGKKWKLWWIFLGSKITEDGDANHKITRCLLLGRKAMSNLDSILKSRDVTLPTKVHIVKAMIFPGHVWMWELDHKETWEPKNWCFWTVVLEKTFESSLNCKEIKLVNPKGNQSFIFIGRTGAEAEAPILWPPDAKNWLFWKDPDAEKDWQQEEKGVTEDEMVGWHHLLYGYEFEQAPGVGDGQGSLVCCSPGIAKCQTEQLHWTYKPTCMHAKEFQSCLTLCDPMDCSLPGSSARGILQATIPEWVVMPSSEGYSWPRSWTCISYDSYSGRSVLYH